MKAISLWQPWASAMAMGLKKNETRHWSTSYRGPLLIHAAKKKVKIPYELLKTLTRNGLNPYEVDYGVLVCKVDLIDCQQIGDDNRPPHDSLEYQLGNYDHGRWMWITDNLQVFDPIAFRGSQGFFNIPDNIIPN